MCDDCRTFCTGQSEVAYDNWNYEGKEKEGAAPISTEQFALESSIVLVFKELPEAPGEDRDKSQDLSLGAAILHMLQLDDNLIAQLEGINFHTANDQHRVTP